MEAFDIFQHVDLIAIAIVILGGLIGTKYFKWWDINNATKTLIFGTVFIGIYIAILQFAGQIAVTDYSKYFISYTVATSLYEIIKKILIEQIKGKYKNPNNNPLN